MLETLVEELVPEFEPTQQIDDTDLVVETEQVNQSVSTKQPETVIGEDEKQLRQLIEQFNTCSICVLNAS